MPVFRARDLSRPIRSQYYLLVTLEAGRAVPEPLSVQLQHPGPVTRMRGECLAGAQGVQQHWGAGGGDLCCVHDNWWWLTWLCWRCSEQAQCPPWWPRPATPESAQTGGGGPRTWHKHYLIIIMVISFRRDSVGGKLLLDMFNIPWPLPHVDNCPVPERAELHVILQHNEQLPIPDIHNNNW